MTDFRGEIAALSAALFWALASLIYARLGQRMPPLWLNLTKSSFAIGLILLTLLLRQNGSPQLSLLSFGLLALSGAIGIGLGDSVFFASLTCLGARRALLLEAIAPPLSACLAALFLSETLKLTAWLGIALTVAGVAWVVVERTPNAPGIAPGQLRRGLLLGLLAALAQAVGAVLSRAALVSTAVSPLWSSLIRLAAGALVLGLWLLGPWLLKPWLPSAGLRGFRSKAPQANVFQDKTGQPPSPLQPLASRSFLLPLLLASFVGTYLGIWLQQTALKYTATGIAQALTATSPLFIIPIARLTGETISLRAILGALLALAGIWLLFNA
ncbi:MAG: EamA family transporter [Elainella sp.]